MGLITLTKDLYSTMQILALTITDATHILGSLLWFHFFHCSCNSMHWNLFLFENNTNAECKMCHDPLFISCIAIFCE